MEIRQIEKNKKKYLDLLLLADEQESMIDQYLEKGQLFIMTKEQEEQAAAVAVVTWEDSHTAELKNLAVATAWQRKGLGKAMVAYLCQYFAKAGAREMIVGTGDSPLTIPFYEACGFIRSHIKENFFTENYDHPIWEEGVQLIHMIYLKKNLLAIPGNIR